MAKNAVQALDTDIELEDYRDNPEFYEMEERARPDEMAMIYGAAEKALHLTRQTSGGKVLDFCSGTGLSHEKLVDDPSIVKIVGVDISEPYVSFAKKRFENSRTRPSYVMGDAVTVPLPAEQWDIVMMCSAYHHIEDTRKVQFLKRVRFLIGNSGYGVMAENILPDYRENSKESYAAAVSTFYTEVLKTAKEENPALPAVVSRLICRVAKYGFDGDYEYKVSRSIFHAHLEEAGLEIVSEERVWPRKQIEVLGNGGNYVVVVRAKDS